MNGVTHYVVLRGWLLSQKSSFKVDKKWLKFNIWYLAQSKDVQEILTEVKLIINDCPVSYRKSYIILILLKKQ